MARKPSAATLRRRLVDELASMGNVTDKAVRRAFLAVPREHFLPADTPLDEVYANKAIVTRKDAYNAPTSSSSQPSIMALMLERLRLAPGMRVLEIGAGTGYNAALLSTLVGERGSVTSVELQPDVAESAAAALRDGGYTAAVVTGDGRQGWPPGAPYDRIILTASTGTVERAWFDQLVPGGLVELPMHLRGPHVQAVVTLRKEASKLRSVDTVEGGFMNLRHPDAQPGPWQGASISLGEHVDGRRRSFGSLGGDDLRRLSPAARRRIAALMLDEPRVANVRSASGVPTLWLELAKPPGAVTARYARSRPGEGGWWGVGVASISGRALAVVTFARSRAVRVESYGDSTAGEALDGMLDDWRARGRPGTRDLDVTVTYRDGTPRTGIGWRQPSTVSSRR